MIVFFIILGILAVITVVILLCLKAISDGIEKHDNELDSDYRYYYNVEDEEQIKAIREWNAKQELKRKKRRNK